jgi:hypothetical protein
VAAELPLLGDLLQQRVAGDLLRARPPQGHLRGNWLKRGRKGRGRLP